RQAKRFFDVRSGTETRIQPLDKQRQQEAQKDAACKGQLNRQFLVWPTRRGGQHRMRNDAGVRRLNAFLALRFLEAGEESIVEGVGRLSVGFQFSEPDPCAVVAGRTPGRLL